MISVDPAVYKVVWQRLHSVCEYRSDGPYCQQSLRETLKDEQLDEKLVKLMHAVSGLKACCKASFFPPSGECVCKDALSYVRLAFDL